MHWKKPLEITGDTENLISKQANFPCGVIISKSIVYQCTKKEDKFVWEFKGPEAYLLDSTGKKTGMHSVGPVWEYMDGSKVVGNVLKRAPNAKNADAIHLLLLEVKARKGKGKFSKVTRIQCVNTMGGKEPAAKPEASNEGQIVWVPYTATYHFYAPK